MLKGGQNDQKKSIPMTAPVLTSFTNSQPDLINANSFCNVSMSFYVPKDVQANTPNPVDSAVKIEAVGGVTVAVIRFSGYAKMADNIKMRDLLIQKLGVSSASYDTVNMIAAGYDAPFKFFDRRNEVMLLKLN